MTTLKRERAISKVLKQRGNSDLQNFTDTQLLIRGRAVFKRNEQTEERLKLHKQLRKGRCTELNIYSDSWEITSRQDMDLLQMISEVNCQRMSVSIKWKVSQKRDLAYIQKFNRSLVQINFLNLQRLELSHSFESIQSLSMINAPLLERIRLFKCTISSLKPFAKINFRNLKNLILVQENSLHQFNYLNRARMSAEFQYQNFDSQLEENLNYNTLTTLLKYSLSSLGILIKKSLNKYREDLSQQQVNQQTFPNNRENSTLNATISRNICEKFDNWIRKQQ